MIAGFRTNNEVDTGPIFFKMEDPNFLDTSRGNLILTNQFIEFSLRVKKSATIYGIGERRGIKNKKGLKMTKFASF